MNYKRFLVGLFSFIYVFVNVSYGSVLKFENDKYIIDVPDENLTKLYKLDIDEKDGGFDAKISIKDNLRFDYPAKIIIKLDEDVKDEDLDKWNACYIYDGKEYYIEPNVDKLKEKNLEFESYHFSFFKSKKLSDDELKNKFAKQLAINETMIKAKVDEVVKNKDNPLCSFANNIYDSLGITDDKLRGVLLREFVSDISSSVNSIDTSYFTEKTKNIIKNAGYTLSGLELLNSAQDGDVTGFTNKLASLILDECTENWSDIAKNYTSQTIGAIPEALYVAIEEGDTKGALEHIAKSLASANPIVQYTQLAANITQMGIDTWTDSEMEIAYKIYSGEKGIGGYGNEDDWDNLLLNMRGAYTQLVINAKKQYCEVNGISIDDLNKDEALARRIETQVSNDLKKQFEARKNNENIINQNTNKYKNIIDSFDYKDGDDEVHLMTRGKNGFNKNDDATFRLSRLMKIRAQIVEMLGGEDVENLYSIFGTRNINKQNQCIAQLVEIWFNSKNSLEGRKKVIEEVKYIYDKDLNKKNEGKKSVKENDGDYAWVLVETEVMPGKFFESEVYRNTYNATETSHTLIAEKIWKDDKRKGTFTATCTPPPSKIKKDQEILMDVTVSGGGTIGDGQAWVIQDTADKKWGYVTWNRRFEKVLEDEPCVVGIGENDRKYSASPYKSIIAGGNEGDKMAIVFIGCGSETKWIYEWKKD